MQLLENDNSNNLVLNYHRVYALICAIVYALWGPICEYFIPESKDSFFLRLPVFICLLASLIFSYRKNLNLKIFMHLMTFNVVFATIYYYYIASLNNYYSVYQNGFFVVVSACYLGLGTFNGLLIYLFLTKIISIYGLAQAANTENSMFWYLMISVSFMNFILNFYRLVIFNSISVAYQTIKKKTDQIEAFSLLATQVAHDIRSPVMAIEALSKSIGSQIPPNNRKLLENTARRINEIADNLISEYRTQVTKSYRIESHKPKKSMNELLQEIVDEKSIVSNSYIINLKFSEIYHLPESFSIIEFKRVISNLINNSIESFDKSFNQINIDLSSNSKFILIKISDNGRGIPTVFLNKIFNIGVSLNKVDGTGLGLTYAKEVIEKYSGYIQIESTINIGTTITLNIKR